MDKFYVSTVCTKRVLKEFLLLKYSMDLYHSNCNWLLSADKYVTDYFEKDDTVECFEWIGESGIHRSGDKDTLQNYEKLIKTKMDILNVSFDRHGYGFILDTDMIMVHPFSDKFFNLFVDDIPHDVVVSHHHLSNIRLEKYVGKYNGGMVLVRNKQFIQDWKDITETGKYFYEQKPIEVAIETKGYDVALYPKGINVANWRFDHNPSLSFSIKDDGFYIDEDIIYNLHVHVIEETIPYADPTMSRFSHKVLDMFKNTNNEIYKKIYEKIGELNELESR